ncbi:MAG TPA: hypothetical protein VJ598_06145 [Albitalea sp.]|nr:hypothetical protein [Albitalea sp.]
MARHGVHFAALAFGAAARLAARSLRLREQAKAMLGGACGLVALLWTLERGRLLIARLASSLAPRLSISEAVRPAVLAAVAKLSSGRRG